MTAKAEQTGQNSTVSSAFPQARGREPGYRRDQVDAFLARARASYETAEPTDDSGAPVTSQEIRETAFAVKRKGYSSRYVDAAMDRLEEVFFERERKLAIESLGEEDWWAQTRQLLSEVRGRLDRPKGKRFSRRGFFASGYSRSEVDAFLDRVRALLVGEGALTTAEVRGAVFHTKWRGYSEDQVDAFLDAVIVLMLSVR